MEIPQVSFFTVFNGNQIDNFPEFKAENQTTDLFVIADNLIKSSMCPINEIAQPRAYYDVTNDKIVLPPRGSFKDGISFIKTLAHEMSHSTGHRDRLKRDLINEFGTEAYAKEELRAELGSLFLSADLGISNQAEHYEDHSDYLKSWIAALENDYNEFFRACSSAEEISQYLVTNYEKTNNIKITKEIEPIPDNIKNKKIETNQPTIERKSFR